ncbi:hypothetical protein NUW58_g6759 [Xylaria curta]|uniref:Uncharacterized protein n=1 Tax=Xylaria curta TaxID=42375 RepID=A0ACC1NQL3_9PEZI|nr:hypothetical protein NUW58_g6759 [Xylaria curta]
MPSPEANKRRPRRVSFAEPEPSDNTPAHPDSQNNPNSPRPAINNNNNNNTRRPHPPSPSPHISSPPSSTCPAPQTATPAADKLAGLFAHTVTNTPQGLVVNGVLQPRGIAHSELRNTHPQLQLPPQASFNLTTPPYLHNTGYPCQPTNMASSVGAGMTPDPNAIHYQPPVPDTTYGPYQHTYVPRADPSGPQYMMANGMAVPGGPSFYAPPAFPYQQVQPQTFLPMHTPVVHGPPFGFFMNASFIQVGQQHGGMASSFVPTNLEQTTPQSGIATAPIPVTASSNQPPFLQAYPMQATQVNFQPGPMPPMAYPSTPNIPAFVATGGGQPTPPANAYFPGGGNVGGFEMGKTKAELDAETQYNAQHNQMNEPQGIKPADDDISRMYWCRELDGQWVSRSRFSLDRMGNFRWYVAPNGVFYAKMLVE